MDCTAKIIRTSIHTFLKYFHYFTTVPLLLLLPFSASVLLSQTLFKPIKFHAQFFDYSIFDLSVSSHQIKPQTVFPFVLTLPFSISSFIMAKASIIQALNHHHKPPTLQPPFFSFIMSAYYKPLLLTHLSSLAMIIAIKSAATFSLLFISLQSFMLPYTFMISNLALVVAGMGACKGHVAIYKACCLLIRKGKNFMAFLLFLPTNLGIVAVEALFRFRVMRIYQFSGRINASMTLEGLLIAYLYSLLIVLDTIICCLFYKSCEPNSIARGRIHRSCCDTEIVLEIEPFDE